MKESNELLNERIDIWVESLTERLIEIRFFDVEKIKVSLKSHFKMAMMDSLKIQISKTEAERNEKILMLKTAKGSTATSLKEIMSKINIKLKSENKLYAELDRDRQAKEMVLWMREKHPQSILDFYNMYDNKFPKTR